MTQGQRSIAFFSAVLLTFGISSFNFEYPEYANNELAYFVIGAGIIMAIVFFITRFRNR